MVSTHPRTISSMKVYKNEPRNFLYYSQSIDVPNYSALWPARVPTFHTPFRYLCRKSFISSGVSCRYKIDTPISYFKMGGNIYIVISTAFGIDLTSGGLANSNPAKAMSHCIDSKFKPC